MNVMRKRWPIILLVAAMTVLYTISAYLVFLVSKDEEFSKFESYCVKTIGVYEDFYGSATDPEETAFFYSYFVNHYPSLLTIYDSKFNVVANNKSAIFMRGESFGEDYHIVYLDEYLNDDIRKTLSQLDFDWWQPCQFDYNEKDGKIIPVAITFYDGSAMYMESAQKFEIRFSDEKAENSIYCNLDDGTNVVNEVILTFVDIENKGYVHDSYEYMKNIISAEDVRGAGGDNSVDSYSINNEAYFDNLFEVETEDGTFYYLHAQIKTDIASEVFKQSEFKERIASITAVYIVLSSVSVFVYVKIKRNKERLENAKYAFTNAAAHELKTPLAVIQNQCECVLENVNPQKNMDYVHSIYKESIKMNKLLNSLLQYNKLTLAPDIEKAETDISLLVNGEIDKYSQYAKSMNITITSDIENCTAFCNADTISMVIGNFLSNAIKYSTGNEIKVELIKTKKGCKFSVFNYSERLEDKNIWNILSVNDASRTGNSTGMGLAISKQILDLHKFKYGFKNRDGGVEFYFIAHSF